MRYPPPKLPAATSLVPAFMGPRVPEGTYALRLIKGKKTLDGEVHLVPDRRSLHSAEDRRQQQEIALQLYDALADLTYAVESLVTMRDAATQRMEGLRKSDAQRLETYSDSLETLRATLVSTSKSGVLSGDEKLRERMGNLYGVISTYDGKPSGSQLAETEKLLAELQEAGQRIDAAIDTELEPLNRMLERCGKEPLQPLTGEAWEAEQAGSNSQPATYLSKLTKWRLARQWTAGMLAF